jgi:hypothetical protein
MPKVAGLDRNGNWVSYEVGGGVGFQDLRAFLARNFPEVTLGFREGVWEELQPTWFRRLLGETPRRVWNPGVVVVAVVCGESFLPTLPTLEAAVRGWRSAGIDIRVERYER